MRNGNRLEGNGRQPCTIPGCHYFSVSGLIKGAGKCPYHWALGVWGEAHADKCYPEYKNQTQKNPEK